MLNLTCGIIRVKSGPNQRLCYLLNPCNVDYETAQWSDKHMGREGFRHLHSCWPHSSRDNFSQLPLRKPAKKRGRATRILVCFKVSTSKPRATACLAQHCGNGSKQVTLGSDCVWVQERREGEGVFGSWVGGEHLDGGEQERQIACGKQDFLLEPGQ